MSDKASELVRATQMMLAHAGYLRGDIDGLLGDETLNALERFNFDQFLKGDQWTIAQMERAKRAGADRDKERKMEETLSLSSVTERLDKMAGAKIGVDRGSDMGDAMTYAFVKAGKVDGPVVARGQHRLRPVMTNDVFSLRGLQQAVDIRADYIDPHGTLSPLFFATEMAGEFGEACNDVKKLERERMGIPGSTTTVEHLSHELADAIITACNLARSYHIDLTQAIIDKFNITSDERKLPVMLK